MAIRATSDYYDRCAERDEREACFFYDGTYLSCNIICCADSNSPCRMRSAKILSVMDADYQSAHLAFKRSI